MECTATRHGPGPEVGVHGLRGLVLWVVQGQALGGQGGEATHTGHVAGSMHCLHLHSRWPKKEQTTPQATP